MEETKQEILNKIYRFDWKRELRSCFFWILLFSGFLWWRSHSNASMIAENPLVEKEFGAPLSLVPIFVIAFLAAIGQMGITAFSNYLHRTQKPKSIRFLFGALAVGILIANLSMHRAGKISIAHGIFFIVLIVVLPLLSEFMNPILDFFGNLVPKKFRKERKPLERGQMPEKGWWSKYN